MDPATFDRLSRALATAPTRRSALAGLSGTLVGLVSRLVPGGASETAAQPRVCRPLGKPCFPNRGLACCHGAACQDGVCRCPKRTRRCGQRCLPKRKCCHHRDCPGNQRCLKNRCQCPAGKKRCGKRCIAKSACCHDRECGAHEACVRGDCACANGAKPCGEACIPADHCCHDTDCGLNGACVQGVCDCASGFESCRGACIPDDSACCEDAECGEHGVCTLGVCGCADGYELCRGACIPTDSVCCQDNECGANEICVLGVCTCASGFERCQGACIPDDSACCLHSDCGPNKVCTLGVCECFLVFKPCGDLCIPSTGCCDNGDCAPDQTCENHVCVNKPCGEGGPCRVFVTSTGSNGALGGVAGADLFCQSHANVSPLTQGGTYKAWISGSEDASSPANRFTNLDNTGPYVLVDDAGTIIANDWDDLTNEKEGGDYLRAPINITQNGLPNTSLYQWTHTLPDGSAGGTDPTRHCQDWMDFTASALGDAGSRSERTSSWTDIGQAFCDQVFALYCFEQG